MIKLIQEVSRMRGSLDEMIPELKKTISVLQDSIKDHDRRIDLIEQEKVIFKTKAGVFSSIFGVLGGIIVSILVAAINKNLL